MQALRSFPSSIPLYKQILVFHSGIKACFIILTNISNSITFNLSLPFSILSSLTRAISLSLYARACDSIFTFTASTKLPAIISWLQLDSIAQLLSHFSSNSESLNDCSIVITSLYILVWHYRNVILQQFPFLCSLFLSLLSQKRSASVTSNLHQDLPQSCDSTSSSASFFQRAPFRFWHRRRWSKGPNLQFRHEPNSWSTSESSTTVCSLYASHSPPVSNPHSRSILRTLLSIVLEKNVHLRLS